MHPNNFLKTYWRMEVRPEIFVAMSFADQYKARYDNIISPAICDISIADVHLKPNRVDLSKTGDSILTDIMDGIAHSQMILADVSTMGYDAKTGIPYRNGNVMYEVGLALACRQPWEVLLVRDDTDKFLFDVSTIPHMHLDFTKTIEAREKLREELIKRLKERNFVNDARIFLAISTMTRGEISFLNEIHKMGPSTVWGKRDEISTLFGMLRTMDISRLLDKQMLKSVGEFEDGTRAYSLTEFGSLVAQIIKNNPQIFISKPIITKENFGNNVE